MRNLAPQPNSKLSCVPYRMSRTCCHTTALSSGQQTVMVRARQLKSVACGIVYLDGSPERQKQALSERSWVI